LSIWHGACFEDRDNANRSFSMTAATADHEIQKPAAEERKVALPLRNDTVLGVCEAVGRDFGFNPNWLRIAFAPLILISPLTALGAYLGLGLFVAASHWLFPATASTGVKAEPAELHAADDNDQSEDRLAA
jgi:phage shock protein PspC (stress-responsive transcriptional regulator)